MADGISPAFPGYERTVSGAIAEDQHAVNTIAEARLSGPPQPGTRRCRGPSVEQPTMRTDRFRPRFPSAYLHGFGCGPSMCRVARRHCPGPVAAQVRGAVCGLTRLP